MKTKTLLISTTLLAAVGVGTYFTVPKVKAAAANMKELVYNIELEQEVNSNSGEINTLQQRYSSAVESRNDIESRLDLVEESQNKLEDNQKRLEENYQKIEILENVVEEKSRENCLRLGNFGMVCLGDNGSEQTENYLVNEENLSKGEFYHELSSSLAQISQEDLILLSKESLDLLETENYDSVIREKDIDHWNETMERNYNMALCDECNISMDNDLPGQCTDEQSSWINNSIGQPLMNRYNTIFRRTEGYE